MNKFIEQLVEKLKHRYLHEEDNIKSYVLSNTLNIVHLYIDYDAQNNQYFKFFKKVDIEGYRNYHLKAYDLKTALNKIEFNENKNIYNGILFEGIFTEKNFYIYDILCINNKEINQNYTNRLQILQNIIKIFKQNYIKLSKIYTNKNLEGIMNNLLPRISYKPKFILCLYNFDKQYINIQNVEDDKKEKINEFIDDNKIKFKYEMIENKEIMKAECFKTNKTEIFLFKHKDLYFNFRIKTLNDALHLRELKDLSTLSLKYSTDFEKYEYFKE